MDRNRSGFEAFAAFAIEIAGIGDKFTEPLKKIVVSIASVYGKAKDIERTSPQLITSSKVRQIAAPELGGAQSSAPVFEGPESLPGMDEDSPV